MKYVFASSLKTILVILAVMFLIFAAEISSSLLLVNEFSPPFESSLKIICAINIPMWFVAATLALTINYFKTIELQLAMSIPIDLAAIMVCDLNYLDGRKATSITRVEFLNDIDEYTQKGWIENNYRELLVSV